VNSGDRIEDIQRDGQTKLVYRPRDAAEAKRTTDRAYFLVGIEWIKPAVPLHKVMFEWEGHLVRAQELGMVFNDACLMDAISGWGVDGPLYRDTLDRPVMRKAYTDALALYEGIEIPEKLRNPSTPDGHPPPFGTANEKPLQPEPPAGGNKE
jgi:hypothetical protein